MHENLELYGSYILCTEETLTVNYIFFDTFAVLYLSSRAARVAESGRWSSQCQCAPSVMVRFYRPLT